MSSALGTSLQAIAAMAVVIALILGMAWLARRFTGGVVQGGGLLRVRSAAAVGARERVVIVEVADKWLVVGVATGNVNLLATLPRGDTGETPAPAPLSFLGRLGQAQAKYER